MGFLKSIWKKFEKKRKVPKSISSSIKQGNEKKKNTALDYCYIHVEDLPDTIENKTIYIIGEDGYEWLVVFKCPCGCNDTIQLNLLLDGEKVWRIIYHHDGTISISPSVRRIVNCKSHFTISRNMVTWWGLSDESYY